MSRPPIIENIAQVASPSLRQLTHLQRKAQFKLARHFARLARHYAVLADYALGMKIEEIAARNGISHRMVSYIAEQHAIEHPLFHLRPQGRPKGSTKSPASPPAVGKPHEEPFGSAGGEDQALELAA